MLNLIINYSKENNFEKIKSLTLDIEKNIMNGYNNNDFKRLIDSLMTYSDYSFFNTLLIDYQYPNFLDLKTKDKYSKLGYKISDNAIQINILSPSVKLIELFDCKDTNMPKENYKQYDLPILFYSSYNDIYTPFCKAIYSLGYKICYCDNLDKKYSYDKNSKTINVKNGLNNYIKMKCILDVYSSDVTSNDFDKNLLNYAINKSIGIDDEFAGNISISEWYSKTNIKNVDHSFKILISKGKKFIDKFSHFYNLEMNNRYILCDEFDLYSADISF